MSNVDRNSFNETKNKEYAARSQEHVLQARRQQLRERDPDLRALVQRLQNEYVGKELEQQIVENQYRKMKIQVANINNDRLVNESGSNDVEDVQTEQADLNKKIRYGRELKKQIQVLQQRRREEHERDALNEKNMVDGVVRAIQEEDRRHLQEVQDKKHEGRKEMLMFMAAQKDLKERQKIILAEEEEFLENQQMQTQDRGNNIFAEKQRKLDIQFAINKKVIDKMLADKAAREERENLVRNLVEHEHKERTIQQESLEKRKNLEITKYNNEMLQGQIQRTELLKIQQAQEDHLYSEELAKQAAAEQKKKHEEMCRVRAGKVAYATCLRQQIQHNQHKRQAERDDQRARNTRVATHHRRRKRDVSEEKRKLLEEHRMLHTSC